MGWRLPAPELESLVADLVRKHLRVPMVQANIVCDATTEHIASVAKQLTDLATTQHRSIRSTN